MVQESERVGRIKEVLQGKEDLSTGEMTFMREREKVSLCMNINIEQEMWKCLCSQLSGTEALSWHV